MVKMMFQVSSFFEKDLSSDESFLYLLCRKSATDFGRVKEERGALGGVGSLLGRSK